MSGRHKWSETREARLRTTEDRERYDRARRDLMQGLVEVVRMRPETVPYPVDAEHPPADFDG